MFKFENMEEIRTFIANEVMFTSEACKYLGITPQRLNQLIQSGKLMPIKVNRTGSLFLKKDLDERKKELQIHDRHRNKNTEIREKIKMKNNPLIVQEAINYYTIKSFFNQSDKKTMPVFSQLSASIDLSVPLPKNISDVSKLLGISSIELARTYNEVLKGFHQLAEDDLIIKNGTDFYPKLLSQTNEAPPYLFMRGNVRLVDYPTVAVVGTRNPTEEGINKAWNLARLLGKYRLVVASGLAKGIDTAAHQGSLNNKYPTIAVIGTPLTKVYPKENEKLQQQIAEEGLIISQFPPSSPIQRWNFPMRNAVMSGISLATVIVEAGETSGALIQADYALKQKRLVFIPQSALSNPKLKWPKKYVQRDGAESFSKIDELINKLQQSKIIETQETLFDHVPYSKQEGNYYVFGSE